jgi:hypothetical protein
VPNPADQRLVEVITRGFAARDQLLAMSEDDVATMPITQLPHLQRVARRSYLEPTVVRSILPVIWTEQRRALKFASP